MSTTSCMPDVHHVNVQRMPQSTNYSHVHKNIGNRYTFSEKYTLVLRFQNGQINHLILASFSPLAAFSLRTRSVSSLRRRPALELRAVHISTMLLHFPPLGRPKQGREFKVVRIAILVEVVFGLD